MIIYSPTFTGSVQITGSQTVTGDLTVQGNLTAQTFILSSSVSYFTESFASGSTRFGDSIDDTMVVTGSMRVTGSITTSIGSSFIVGAGSNYVAPSPTRGVIQINGSSDQFLNLGTNGYILGSSTLCRFLSIPDLDFVAGGAQRMFISGSGQVGIGTTAPSRTLHVVDGTSVTIGATKPGTDSTQIGVDSVAYIAVGGDLTIRSGGFSSSSERMRITSGGYFKASNTGSYNNLAGNYHEFNQSLGGNTTMVVRNFGSTNGSSILCFTPSADTSEYFLAGSSGGTTKVYIYTNGNIQNTNNSYGAISDIKLKENITDAKPKLDDLLKVKIRNYNLIGEETKQIGVIAQELEEIFPSMIDESEDFKDIEIIDENGNTIIEREYLGTKTKSVKYSVFVPMLIKAIQELKAEIDELKNK